jgi:hypothetical protein
MTAAHTAGSPAARLTDTISAARTARQGQPDKAKQRKPGESPGGLHPRRSQQRIARAYFGPAREVCAILPRGNAKTTTAALIGLHHLLSVEGAAVTIGAASRDQARIAFERMRADSRGIPRLTARS